MKLDHSYIEEENIVDRYVLGKLTQAESYAFEDHFLTCGLCMDKVENSEQFSSALKEAFPHGIPSHKEKKPKWFHLPPAILWATICLLLIGLVFTGNRLRQYGPMKDQIERQENQYADLKASIEDLKARVTEIPEFYVEQTRNHSGDVMNRFHMAKQVDFFFLTIDLAFSDFVSYRATIEVNGSQKNVYEHLKPNQDNKIRIPVAKQAIGTGPHKLRLEGSLNQETYLLVIENWFVIE